MSRSLPHPPRPDARSRVGAWRRLTALVVLSVALAGCQDVDLYSQLNERQANELVAALQAAGIPSEKRSRDPSTWTVRVDRDDFARAVDTLRAAGLPRETFETLGQVFRKEGFVSSALEERARLVHGLSQELSSTLSAIDGVVVARVHLAVPERDPLSDKPRPASASVMVKHRPGVDLSQHIGQIKALVVNGVEGLSYDNVTVTLFPAQDAAAAAAVGRPAMPSSTFGFVAGAAAVLVLLGGFLAARRWGWRGAARGRLR